MAQIQTTKKKERGKRSKKEKKGMQKEKEISIAGSDCKCRWL